MLDFLCYLFRRLLKYEWSSLKRISFNALLHWLLLILEVLSRMLAIRLLGVLIWSTIIILCLDTLCINAHFL